MAGKSPFLEKYTHILCSQRIRIWITQPSTLDEEGLARLLKEVGGLEVKELWITGDVRPGRGEEKWLNVLLTGNGAGAVCRCGQGVCASFGNYGYDQGVQDAGTSGLL